jgi:AcrR family transcriptional regulator
MTAMTNVVKRRTYDATARQTQSAATRQRIVDAARELILERGYRATTIAAIATNAGVNTDSVYALVGRKPMVLRELIEQAVSGTDHAVTAEDRAYVKAHGSSLSRTARCVNDGT